MTWKKLKSTILLRHPRITVVEDDVELPSGHATKYIYFSGVKDAVTAIAIRGDSVLIQEEYSYPPNQIMYQFPGGGIEKDEAPETAALRELKEESGYSGTPKYLGSYFTNNRRSGAKMYVVLIEDVIECKKEGGDLEESITSEWVSLEKLRFMMAEGKIVNFSILAGMALFDAHHQSSSRLEA